MQLRRIEIRDFRKLGHAVVDGLGDGLNVIVGDNEAGKSTLLAALRAVLFERHRVTGEVTRAMLPHGQAVRPEITVEFDLKGASWRLKKAFNQRPEAELTGPGVRLTGDAVEERLADLFGFHPPERGAAKPDEHHGIYGLLWVEQASAHKPMAAVAARGSLAAALETEVGQVMGGERGRHLLAMAEERRNAFWDKRGDKARGALRTLRETIGGLDGQRAELEASLRRHDEHVAALTAKSEALARHAREDRLAAAVRSVEQAREAAEKAARLAAAVEDLGRAHARALVDRDTAAERLRARQTLVAKVEAGQAAAALAAEVAREAKGERDRAEGLAAGALARATAVRLEREGAERRLALIEAGLERRKAREAFEQTSGRLDEAETVDAKRRDALSVVAAVALTKKDIADLDRLGADAEAARVKRDVASVQLQFEPLSGGAVLVDGAAHDPRAPLRLAGDAVLDLAGFGRVTVRPGGGVTALSQAVETAERHLADRLRALGQSSRATAAAALDRKTEAETEAAAQARVFAVLAPEGLNALRQAAQRLRAAIGEDGDGAEQAAPPATEADRAAARRAAQDLQSRDKDAEREAARLGAARETDVTRAAVLNERNAAALREVEAAVRALEAARTQAGDQVLDIRLVEAQRAEEATAEAERAARGALAAADPDLAGLELRRAEAAERAIRADIETLTREKRDLEITLLALGKDGIGERLAEIEGNLARLRQQEVANSLEAQASLLLHDTLMQAQTETKDRWLGPVRERVRPYLKLIQPDSEIVLNEKSFSIEHLLRGGVAEPFDTLSVGAREQIAVITRLALADILRASGQPSAIILDDALVNTDEGRLERMHLVLQKAAESLQVLVLTCRERDFLTLGAPIRRL